jgi:hypothetical protein
MHDVFFAPCARVRGVEAGVSCACSLCVEGGARPGMSAEAGADTDRSSARVAGVVVISSWSSQRRRLRSGVEVVAAAAYRGARGGGQRRGEATARSATVTPSSRLKPGGHTPLPFAK